MTELLHLDGVSKTFRKKRDALERFVTYCSGEKSPQGLQAVSDFSLKIDRGTVVGLVGESGCGKSTVGRIAAGLYEPDTGIRKWRGSDIATLPADLRHKAALEVQMIFQDPYASLNPRMRALEIVSDGARAHGLVSAQEARGFVENLFERVGLPPALMERYPHQFSGGQRARIGIARALSVNPSFLVCDESVAALDVSVQAQVLNLFMRLRDEEQLTYLFISHDLGVVRHISDSIVVMYLGRVVEAGKTEEVYNKPLHPYTQALLDEVPTLDRRSRKFGTIKGEIPSPLNPPNGCRFHPRCPRAMERCSVEKPVDKEMDSGHRVACHLY